MEQRIAQLLDYTLADRGDAVRCEIAEYILEKEDYYYDYNYI